MKKTLKGKIISLKMQKTAIVLIERVYKHPRYIKVIRKHKKYKARYDDSVKLAVGDMVTIQECRPLSKEVHFKIVHI